MLVVITWMHIVCLAWKSLRMFTWALERVTVVAWAQLKKNNPHECSYVSRRQWNCIWSIGICLPGTTPPRPPPAVHTQGPYMWRVYWFPAPASVCPHAYWWCILTDFPVASGHSCSQKASILTQDGIWPPVSFLEGRVSFCTMLAFGNPTQTRSSGRW